MEAASVAITPVRARARLPLVLVVDDEPAIRMICCANLRLDGCEVLEARNGEEALELARAAMPDLVLVDVNMPVLDGFGLADALRADQRTSNVPFIFLTGERDPGIEARALEAGAAGYFPKPFDPRVVGAFVRGILARNAPASPGTGAQSNRRRSASVGA